MTALTLAKFRAIGVFGLMEKTLKTCKEELKSIFEEWILLTLKDGGTVRGLRIGKKVSFNINAREFAKYA